MKYIEPLVWGTALVFLACQPKPQEVQTETIQVVKIPEKVVVYQTAENSDDRLVQKGEYQLVDFGQPTEIQPCVFIDPTHKFQTFVGIGGAFTDAAAEVFAKLPTEKQQEFLTAYYDADKGIGYNFSRTHIASCDFSSASYDYIAEGDSALATFSIDHDRTYRIPFIKQAIQAAGGSLKMFVSPWSPPAWMKDNNDRLHGGHLLEQYKQSWANHYVKFIEAYEAEGIPVWGLSVQNEPMAVQIWESCVYSDTEERDFVKNNLGPTLAQAGMGEKKLIVWDHNRDLIYQRASTMLNDPEAAKYVWGVGFHWYEPWTGGGMQFDNLKRVQESFPDINLVFTEGCVERFGMDRITNWALGERYGHSMIHDFNAGTVAWTDWNILLDENGGPNHVGNFCFAPVHADTQKGELIFTNSYYYIGHFSKFIQAGARRISCSTSREVLEATAFENPDGSLAVVVMNAGDEELSYHIWIEGRAAELKSPAHSIQTLIL
ncbi:glycoside hydrolase family 30 beta sandwich domain-containing protein [Mangrovibacterium sp.]|uniref:glycoside hydrolase family 30 protein n=1 Tax=Mangrovibacterium sp. TaxID=1961364 RepID=UPI00356582BA